MSGIRAQLASRLRSSSLSAVPPRPESQDYSPELARHATSILFRSPIPSPDRRPVYILNAAALPDSREENFDSLLPYVLARLPEEDELVRGFEYEVVFFAGDSDGSATSKRNRPGWGWFLQAYHVLTRAMRKRLQKLYIVHEKAWVRILTEIFSTIVSPKFRRKIVHASSLTNLATYITIQNLLIPPSTYLNDRRVSDDIYAPDLTDDVTSQAFGRRGFGTQQPFPTNSQGKTQFPRVLRETTAFLLLPPNIGAQGLFRVPPHSRLKDVLKEAYERGQKFIIWKDNGVMLPLPPYPESEHQDEVIAELDPKDTYSAFMAAALIKTWYSSLRQPAFPQSCYVDLKRLYGNVDDVLDLHRLTELFSPASEWSLLPILSREIMTGHLLPMFSAVAAHEESNKMSAENLAVCIAPALLCGPDQLEDAKMSSIVRRVLTKAVELWPCGLREACGQTESQFLQALELPRNTTDWEDPLERVRSAEDRQDTDENHVSGIILVDNDPPAPVDSSQPPPLPPRKTMASGRDVVDVATRRKPAPPLQVPPRYSTVISDSPIEATSSPLTAAATTNGFAPRDRAHGQNLPLGSGSDHDLDEKYSAGTEHPVAHSTSTSFPPPISLPKRKRLTTEQIDNAEHASLLIQTRKASVELEAAASGGSTMDEEGTSPPTTARANLQIQGQNASPPIIRRKALPSGEYVAQNSPSSSSPPSPATTSSPTNLTTSYFRRTSFPHTHSSTTSTSTSSPASTNRNPTITSLARPLHPYNPPTSSIHRPILLPQPQQPSSSPPSLPKPRTPSAAILQRMPSFETSLSTIPSSSTSSFSQSTSTTTSLSPPAFTTPIGQTRSLLEPGSREGEGGLKRTITPRRLNMKKQSVENLRRLYEERVGTVGVLVEAGRWKR